MSVCLAFFKKRPFRVQNKLFSELIRKHLWSLHNAVPTFNTFPWQVKQFVAWRQRYCTAECVNSFAVAVGFCGQRDEYLLSAAAKGEKRAYDPVPRIGLFHAEVLDGFGLQ